MNENKNYISYALISIIIALFLYGLHLEGKIEELKQQVSDYKEESSIETVSDNNNEDITNINEKIDSLETNTDEIYSMVEKLYEKFIPENEREQELVEVNTENTTNN